MTKESFDKQDTSFMKNLKGLREKKVPPELMKGFSESVEERIRQKQTQKEPQRVFEVRRRPRLFPVWVPVAAVLMLASLVVIRSGMQNPSMPLNTMPPVSRGTLEITQDIAALNEVGAWTEDDDNILNGTVESAVEELEA